MLQLAVMVVGWIFAGVTATYMYSFWKFRCIVKAEKPEWLGQSSGTLSSTYSSQRLFGGPNYSIVLLRIAFSPRVDQLSSAFASVYAKRIRVCLPSSLVLFVVIIGLGLAQAS
jgi:hypothetical protein